MTDLVWDPRFDRALETAKPGDTVRDVVERFRTRHGVLLTAEFCKYLEERLPPSQKEEAMKEDFVTEETIVEAFTNALKKECPVCKAAPNDPCSDGPGLHAKRVWADWK